MQSKLFQTTGRSLCYELPHGEVLFSHIYFSWDFQKCALVGPNGVGKSTLAKIISGLIKPSSGDLISEGQVTYLEQFKEPPNSSVAEYLMNLWESPSGDPLLWGNLLDGIPLEKNLKNLSGGEWTRVRISEALSRGSSLLILDEPTNNLDRSGREVVLSFVRAYKGALLIISHDRELLEIVDGVWELSNQGLQSYGGNYTFYEKQKKSERDLLANKIDRQKREKNKLLKEHREKLSSQEKRMRIGAEKASRGGVPKILLGGMKRRAQETYGSIQTDESDRVESAKDDLKILLDQQKLRTDLNIDISGTVIPEGKLVLEAKDLNLHYIASEEPLWSESKNIVMKGPRRWALRGKNGSGKTSFVRALMGGAENLQIKGDLRLGDVVVRILDQSYSLLNPNQTVLENIYSVSDRGLVQLRNELAKFQFIGEMVNRRVSDLSGGEKLKASLARIFLEDPQPQFLILDEPTNNLDLESLAILENALCVFKGALLIISHDQIFLENIGIDDCLDLDRNSR